MIFSWISCICTFAVCFAFSRNAVNTKVEQSDEIVPESIHIRSPSNNGKHEFWQVDLKHGEHRYLMTLSETYMYSDDTVSIQHTKGNVTDSSGDQEEQFGTARIVFDTTNPGHVQALGSFRINFITFHLEFENHYTLRKELPQFYTQSRDVDEQDTIGVILSRDAGEVDNEGVRQESWPTNHDLEAAVRDNVRSSCFQSEMQAPIGVAADSNFMSSFQSARDARLYISSMVSKASEYWEDAFNISLVLSEIITSAYPRIEDDYPWNKPCDESVDSIESLQSRLQDLTTWRQQNRADDGLALWNLLTDCPSGDVVGLAWQSSACESGGANIVHHSILDYHVLAHETGHVFGAVHDCTNVTCGTSTVCCPLSSDQCNAGSAFIMSPEPDMHQSAFSVCTVDTVCASIKHGLTNISCLLEGNAGPIRSKKCEFTNDPAMQEQCVRNLQCMDYMNSTSSYFCGDIGGCSLKCYEPMSRQCRDGNMPLLDRTPCGYPSARSGHCFSGKCSSKSGKIEWTTWTLVAVTLTVFSGIFTALAMGYLVVRALYMCKARYANAPSVKVSSPKQVELETAPNPPGLPPILRYASSITDNESASSVYSSETSASSNLHKY